MQGFPDQIVSQISEANLLIMLDIANKAPDGDFIEVGVYQGGSAVRLYEITEQQGRALYLYDTFEGTPYYSSAFDSIPVGEFSDTNEKEIQSLMPNSHVIKGLFPGSILGIHKKNKIAFAHIDCDQYWSVKESIEALKPLMTDGGIMYFDDYGSLAGATKAVDECCRPIILTNGKAIYVAASRSSRQ